MGMSKSPRPTDESNLMQIQRRGQDRGGWSNLLLALAIRRPGVLQPACVFHGDVVALLRLILAVAGRDLSLRDAHYERLYGRWVICLLFVKSKRGIWKKDMENTGMENP